MQKSAKKIRKKEKFGILDEEGVGRKVGKKKQKIKNKKNRKKIEKESEMLEAIRLRPAPKAP